MNIISLFPLEIKHNWSDYNQLSVTIQMSTHHKGFDGKIKVISNIFVEAFSVPAD